MESIYSELIEWFKGLPRWLQDAANRLVLKKELTENDLNELFLLCKSEAGIGEEIETSVITNKLKDLEDEIDVHIKEISDVKNINALSPKSPLKFNGE